MVFWKLWTLFVAILVGLGTAWQLGYVADVIASASTRFSILILILFMSASAWVGVLAVKGGKPPEALWFASDAMLSLGMMGTVLGLLMVFKSNFASVDSTDMTAMLELIGAIGSGMGVALTTTLIGLGASLLLKFELVILDSKDA